MSVLVITLAENKMDEGICCIDQEDRMELSVAAAPSIIAGSVRIH